VIDERGERFAKGDRKITKDVNTYGWHVVKVMPQGDDPGWAYSVGMFRTLEHPEILIFGLPDTSMHAIINHVGERVREGAKFADGVEDGDTLDGYRCVFKAVDKFWYPWIFGYGRWFYGDDEFPALQLIWPDKQSHYPWDSEYRKDLIPLQPLLYEREIDRSRGAALLKSLQKGNGAST